MASLFHPGEALFKTVEELKAIFPRRLPGFFLVKTQSTNDTGAGPSSSDSSQDSRAQFRSIDSVPSRSSDVTIKSFYSNMISDVYFQRIERVDRAEPETYCYVGLTLDRTFVAKKNEVLIHFGDGEAIPGDLVFQSSTHWLFEDGQPLQELSQPVLLKKKDK